MESADSMEDSGFDSDQRPVKAVNHEDDVAEIEHQEEDIKQPSSESSALRALKKSSELRKTSEIKKKLERQREANRKNTVIGDLSKRSILSRSRLVVPTKHEAPLAAPDQQPLVMIDTDDSEEEFTLTSLSKAAHKEITQQLIKDGYNLDLEPDDEDLDLIPPRPLNERCACCPGYNFNSCVLQ